MHFEWSQKQRKSERKEPGKPQMNQTSKNKLSKKKEIIFLNKKTFDRKTDISCCLQSVWFLGEILQTTFLIKFIQMLISFQTLGSGWSINLLNERKSVLWQK